MTIAADHQMAGSFTARVSSDRATLTLVISGRLDMNTTGRLWREAAQVLRQTHPVHLVIDASGVMYCDGAGIAFIVKLHRHQESIGGELTLSGLQEEFRRLLDIYGQIAIEPPAERRREPRLFVEQVGRAGLEVWHIRINNVKSCRP